MSKIAMLHEADPADALRREIGDISKIEMFNTQVLVGVYIRPEKTRGGILLDTKEDRFQSKVGLVLAKGHSAFEESDGKWFDGKDIIVGDWLFFRPSDGWNITINGVLCRILDDVSFRGRIAHPDQVW